LTLKDRLRTRFGTAPLTLTLSALKGREGIFLAAGAAVLSLLLLDRLCPPDLSRYQDRSVAVLASDGTVLRAFTAKDTIWRLGATPKDVDPTYLDLLVAVEDRRFHSHIGIDPLALGRAAWQLVRSGHIVSGGSTLTMQVARLLEPHRRSVIGKLHDVLRAAQLEERFDKDQILSMYLTLAPFGGNLEGVRAASLAYFGHEPIRLTEGEAAILVALPQRPAALRPDRHHDAAVTAANRLLSRLVAEGALPADAAETPAPEITRRRSFPMLARQVADRLKFHANPDSVVRTTLDADLQTGLEAFAARRTDWLSDNADIAILVVDNRSRAIRAWVGGVRTSIDLVRARRSPGSTLKPFVYGMAFDDLAVLPDTLVEDRPMRFGSWEPENFDRGFKGQVTAREALQQSLNLPAIALLDRVGPGRLATTLQAAGARLTFPAGAQEPSLPLALGGVGINLEDLTGLYVGLARGGQPAALRLRADVSPVPARPPLMTPHAARLVTEILRDAPPPDGRIAPSLTSDERQIAFKTGTSYGFRDAWTVGYTPAWTVGIWTGRADGTPRPGYYGRNAAAPLVFAVFDMLPQEPDPERPAALADSGVRASLPEGLKRFATRAAAHALPGAEPPRILYPPEGAVIDLTRLDGKRGTLQLQAEGGAPPYRWSVNGVPLPSQAVASPPQWRPDGPGYARITVLDGAGHRASTMVRLE